MMSEFDLDITDELLSTTRAVRKRLDIERPVPRTMITECLRLAVQAPTGGNRQGWRWLVVTDAKKREALADLYRRGAATYLSQGRDDADARGEKQDVRVFDSAMYLADHLQEVPVHVIPCVENTVGDSAPGTGWSGLFGSIFPAVWSFQLALRARGLGSCLTTLHLRHADEAATLLSIPDSMLQVALLPVAYTKGTTFQRAKRPPVEQITYWDEWGE
jgi:nitroreductase